MQRITRKSSSSKFNLPFSKERSGLFSKKAGEPSTPSAEVEEDGGSDYLGKSVESAGSTPQPEKEKEKGGRPSLSWSRVMSRKSKAGKVSESDRASETETGEEEEG